MPTGPAPAPARGREGALRVFFECEGSRGACDSNELRTEIDWVNWVRDRNDAQVHVIVTSQETGSGGSSYQLDFIGLEDLRGVDDRLTYTAFGTDVRDESVRGVTRTLGVGLARYSLLAGAATVLDVEEASVEGAPERLVASDQVDDPWDFWVFRVDLNTDLSGESSRRNKSLRGGFDASRVTTTWKIDVEARGSWRESEIDLSDSTIVDSRSDWDVEASVAYALADHWSLGGTFEVSAATRTNQDLSVAAGPALEYSVWPYDESTRRALRVSYSVGVRHYDYVEETLFGVTAETRPVEAVHVSLSQRQPWGSVYAGVEASHYLHDLDKYRFGGGGRLSFRIVRGLSLRIDGRVSWIRDQLFLAARELDDQEILLQQRRLASDFDWDFGMGFSFQFGSIYNNVVNNRF